MRCSALLVNLINAFSREFPCCSYFLESSIYHNWMAENVSSSSGKWGKSLPACKRVLTNDRWGIWFPRFCDLVMHIRYERYFALLQNCWWVINYLIMQVFKSLVEITKGINGAKVENNKFCVSVHYRLVNEKVHHQKP